MTTTQPLSGFRPLRPVHGAPALNILGRHSEGPPVRAEGAVADVESQAYCGPAHGQRWAVDEQVDLPAVVDLAVAGACPVRYRLVTHPRSGRPARDHQGRYLYLPSLHQPSPATWDGRW